MTFSHPVMMMWWGLHDVNVVLQRLIYAQGKFFCGVYGMLLFPVVKKVIGCDERRRKFDYH